MKILFCSYNVNDDPGSIVYKDRQRYETLEELGYDMERFSCQPYETYSILDALVFRFGAGELSKKKAAAFNRDFLDKIAAVKPDVVWVEKAVLLLPETITRARKIVPGSFWVSFQDDNPFGRRRNEIPIWRNFIGAIPYHDIHFVKRNGDIEKFIARGARHVAISRTGSYHSFYRPYRPEEVPGHLKHDTVFIGAPLDHRAGSISYLIGKCKLKIDVYGNRWNRCCVYYRHRRCFHGRAGFAYPLIVSGSKICLSYVSSSNMDEYNGRSVEIPSCGGFLLAERTPAHLELYREGKEAEFFGSDEECADKIRFYLRNDSRRREIARAGYERWLKADYSLAGSMREAIREIYTIKK